MVVDDDLELSVIRQSENVRENPNRLLPKPRETPTKRHPERAQRVEGSPNPRTRLAKIHTVRNLRDPSARSLRSLGRDDMLTLARSDLGNSLRRPGPETFIEYPSDPMGGCPGAFCPFVLLSVEIIAWAVTELMFSARK